MRVGDLPITLHAQIPGGELIKIGDVRVPIVSTRSTLGIDGGEGTIYTLGINLEETVKDIRSIFEMHIDKDDS